MSESGTFEKEDLEKYKEAVTYASDHIIITDTHGVIVFANPAASLTTGYTPEEMMGKTPSLWGSQMDRSFYDDMWQTIAVDKKVFKGELRNKRKNGELYEAEVHIAPILTREGEPVYFVGIERDITEQKELEQAKTKFISLASHNLKAPLTSIRWFSEMLLKNEVGELTKKQRNFVEQIHTSSKVMADLVYSLLNISRIELGMYVFEKTNVDVTMVVKSILEISQKLVSQKSLRLTTYFEEATPTLQTDANMLTQVFQNLVNNAIKYNRENGALEVKVFHKNAHEEVYGRYFPTESVIFVVSDEGLGIPESEKGKIFQRFFRASNVQLVEVDGTGLGLYLVNDIITHMGGAVWFSSVEGTGSEFYISLPVTN